MYRWTLLFGLTLALLAVTAATAEMMGTTPADKPIAVLINDQPQHFDTLPIIVQDRVLVPLRGVFESLGASVRWNPLLQQVTATMNDGRTLSLAVGSNFALVNGQPVQLDVPAQMHQERVYVPLRFVCASTGYRVSWEGAERRVAIATPGGAALAKAPICPTTVTAQANLAPAPPVAYVPEPQLQPEVYLAPPAQAPLATCTPVTCGAQLPITSCNACNACSTCTAYNPCPPRCG